MIHGLLNQMRAEALGVMNNRDDIVDGLVKNFDPNTYTCKVLLQPSGILTGWLPIWSPWVGNGWGLFMPPVPDTAVAVIPKNGSMDGAFVLPACFSDVDRPLPVDQGECWFVHQSGSMIQLLNTGAIVLASGGHTMTFVDGMVTFDCPISAPYVYTDDVRPRS